MSAPIVIQKNRLEQLHVGVDEYRGRQLLNMRIWYTTATGELRPGKQGVAVRLELLPELRAALDQVAAEVGRGDAR